jgi:hypothetical protein
VALKSILTFLTLLATFAPAMKLLPESLVASVVVID